MRLSESVTTVFRTLRDRPADLLPFYILGAAVPAVARVGVLLTATFIYAYLEFSGRLETIRSDLQTGEFSPPATDAEPEAFTEWANDLVGTFDPAFTVGVIGLLMIAILLSVAVGFVLYAAAAAGQIAACYACLREESGLETGIAGVRAYWKSFLGLFLLEILAWIGAAVVASLGAALLAGIAIAATGETLLGGLVAVLAVLLWFVAVLVIRAIFAFAPISIVVDDVGATASVSKAAGFVRRQPVEAVFYYVFAIVLLVGISAVATGLAIVGSESVVSLFSLLIVLPALDLLKTVLYGDYRGTVTPVSSVGRSLVQQAVGGVRHGFRELARFVRETPGTHAAVIAVALGGFAMGWAAAGPYEGLLETSIDARLEGHNPVAATAEFFANNWTVALTTAYAGIALVIPAFVSIWFNGIVLGITARLEVEPTELLAFVIPHGVLEIPAIFVAGALGVHLGVVGWRTYQGRHSRSTLASELERAFWVLVGIGVLLAIAAVIEGFVSPYYTDLLF